MKTDRNTLDEMERLYQLWEAEVTSAQEQGRLTEKQPGHICSTRQTFCGGAKGSLNRAAGSGKL